MIKAIVLLMSLLVGGCVWNNNQRLPPGQGSDQKIREASLAEYAATCKTEAGPIFGLFDDRKGSSKGPCTSGKGNGLVCTYSEQWHHDVVEMWRDAQKENKCVTFTKHDNKIGRMMGGKRVRACVQGTKNCKDWYVGG